jgi:hypothetical protein
MGTCPSDVQAGSLGGELEVTEAALGSYGRLLAIVGQRLRTHPTGDGGLICEDRRNYLRPALWRIAPDGVVLPDSRYSRTLSGFTPVPLPQGV